MSTEHTPSQPSWLPPLDEALRNATTALAEHELLLTLPSYPHRDLLEAAQDLLARKSEAGNRLGLKVLAQIPPTSALLPDVLLLLERSLQKPASPACQAEAILATAELAPELLREHLPLAENTVHKIIPLSLVSAWARSSSEWALLHLNETLQNADGELRDWCILQSSQLPNRTGAEPTEHFPPKTSPEELDEVITRLAHADSPFLWRHLLDALNSPPVTAPLLEAAATLADPRLYASLWDLWWTWPGPAAPLNRALQACRWQDPRPTSQLYEDALNQGNRVLSERSITRLQRLGGQEVYDTAAAFCASPDPQMRLVGARVLGKFEGPNSRLRQQAIAPLSRMLADTNHEVLATALEGIGEQKENELTVALDKLQSHQNPEVRKSVSIILYGTNSTPTNTMIALSTAREEQVRLAATEALEEILHPTSASAPGRSALLEGDQGGRAPSPPPLNRYLDDPGDLGTVAPVPPAPPPSARLSRRVAWGLVLCGLVCVAAGAQLARRKIPVLTENPELVTILALNNLDRIVRPHPQQLLQERKPGTLGRSTNKRLRKLISMLRLPIDIILSDKKECWYLYTRLSSLEAAWVLSRATAPPDDTPEGHQLFNPLMELLQKEANSDNHARVANLLRHTAPLNPALSSYLMERLLSGLLVHQRDDLIMDFASVGTELQRLLRAQGQQVPHHPALRYLLPQTNAVMVRELRDGWADHHEEQLAHYLEQL